ncbi:DNA-binding protein [Priestia sp. SB1]|uniref:DNA-binding protein n=1 Tax=Priestia sp. SB1 TaxID=3132359 RepID=UPI00317BFA7C
MTISKNNTRTPLTIDKEFKKKLEEIALEENRSLNNLVVTILQDYVKNRES